MERQNIWGWILEPSLDTEYTDETHQQFSLLLEDYGLTAEQVKTLRMEVKTQMFKYNFDTMLWEWCLLGANDVLRRIKSHANKV